MSPPIWRNSASFIPREVEAGEPKRTPLPRCGGCSSKGMAFLLAVMFARSSSSCMSRPVTPMLITSASIRWLSVPPETRRTPPAASVSARALAFFTTWNW